MTSTAQLIRWCQAPTCCGLGVATGDYDGDGHVDLYVTNFGPNQLWRNQGDGTFRDVTEASGTGGWRRSRRSSRASSSSPTIGRYPTSCRDSSPPAMAAVDASVSDSGSLSGSDSLSLTVSGASSEAVLVANASVAIALDNPSFEDPALADGGWTSSIPSWSQLAGTVQLSRTVCN